MKRVTENHILQMHSLLIQETGGSEGVKDRRLLDSALNLPFQTFDGEDIYKIIRAKASRLASGKIDYEQLLNWIIEKS